MELVRRLVVIFIPKNTMTSFATGAQHNHRYSRLKSFTAEKPVSNARGLFVPASAPKLLVAPSVTAVLLADSSLVVVECETATSVRSGPRFADSALANIPAKTLCCGRR